MKKDSIFSSISIFILTAIIVFFIHYPLFQTIPQLDLSTDDWILRTHFKLLGANPYRELYSYYKRHTAYFAYQTFYIGTLEELFGFNTHAFNLTNLALKILATLSIYPLILVIFKRKLLAVLVTVLFALNYQTAVTLEFIMKGADYVGLLFMNIFLIVYCYIIKNGLSLKWLIFLPILFLAALLSSPARMYPLLIIPILIEFFLILIHKKNIQLSLKRLIIMYTPLIIITALDPLQYINIFTNTPGVINHLNKGYWFQVLVPLAGLGLTLFPPSFLGSWFDGNSYINNLQEYILFLMYRPFIIFTFFTLLISFAKSKNPFRLISIILLINFFLDIVVYFIFMSLTKVDLRSAINSGGLIFILLGIYMLIIGLFFFWKWQAEENKDDMLLALGIGPYFSLVFISLTWILANEHLSFGGAHYYLSVAALGSSLFIASFIVAIYDMFRGSNLKLPIFYAFMIFIILISLYSANSNSINVYFTNRLIYGRGESENSKMRIQMQSFLLKYHVNINDNPSLFYFDESGNIPQNRQFYDDGFTSPFINWIHLTDNIPQAGCAGIILGNLDNTEELENLKKLIIVRNGQKYLQYNGFCLNPADKFGTDPKNNVIYKPENFYIFKLKDRKIIDIREEMFKKLNLNSS